ncbi:hypothetical protein [Algoriphagus sp.]|uniref:hypothetical protein n=1 Tax=Algoriphagus sp. TaxID=1872435 RepID=UPI0032987E6C
MKIRLTILFVFGFFVSAFSQEGLSLHLKGLEGCYTDYYSEFANKGAKAVEDGEHEVVISIIYQNKSNCYLGKATVKDKKLVLPILMLKDDKNYSPLATIFNNIDQAWLIQQDQRSLYEISDGMSKMVKSDQGYLVQLFFPSAINSNSGVNVEAPPASVLLKGN